MLELWRQGVILEGRKTRPAQVRLLQRGSRTLLEIIIQEGRNRQIRRVAQQLGYPVIQLHRTAIGLIGLQLPGSTPLPKGQYRYLKDFELLFLQEQINLKAVQEPVSGF